MICLFPHEKLLSHKNKQGLKIPELFASETNTNLTFPNCSCLGGQKATNLKPSCAHQKMKPAFIVTSLPHIERTYAMNKHSCMGTAGPCFKPHCISVRGEHFNWGSGRLKFLGLSWKSQEHTVLNCGFLPAENIKSSMFVSKYEGLQQQIWGHHLTLSQLPCTQQRSSPIGHRRGVHLNMCVCVFVCSCVPF